jgi:hypothetical protein
MSDNADLIRSKSSDIHPSVEVQPSSSNLPDLAPVLGQESLRRHTADHAIAAVRAAEPDLAVSL